MINRVFRHFKFLPSIILLFFSYLVNGQCQITNFRVNGLPGSVNTDDTSPVLAANAHGRFVIVWVDNSLDTNGDIVARCYDTNGTSLGDGFVINDDRMDIIQKSPAVAMDKAGFFVIAWKDLRHGQSSLYAQRLDIDLGKIGNNFRVTEDGEFDVWTPSIDMDAAGNFTITWRENRLGEFHIFAQRYGRDAVPIGPNFPVYDGDQPARQTSISVADDGVFVIAWTSHESSHGDVWAKLFNSDGTVRRGRFRLNDHPPDSKRFKDRPVAGMFSDGSFVIAWQDRRNGRENSDIYAQFYDSAGIPIESNFRVNDDTTLTAQIHPKVVVDNHDRWFAAWADRRENQDKARIFAQRYTSSSLPLGKNIPLSAGNGNEHTNPDIAVSNGKIITAWRTPTDSGSDIMANVSDWDTGISKDKLAMLSQNYPNPFSNETSIEYQVLSEGFVDLSIYNILGQKMRTLTAAYHPPGSFTVTWDGTVNGRKVANGMYFFVLRLDGAIMQTNRMIIMNQ